MQRALLLFAIACLAATPAGATLLAEIHSADTIYDLGGIRPIPIKVETYNPPFQHHAEIVCPCTTDNLGQVFSAEAAELEKMRDAFVSPVAAIGVGWNAGAWVGEFWTNPTVTRFVPQLGFGLTGYFVSDVTLTIDDIHWILGWQANGQRYSLASAVTMRIYGDQVPEPGALLLGTLAICVLLVSHRRACNASS